MISKFKIILGLLTLSLIIFPQTILAEIKTDTGSDSEFTYTLKADIPISVPLSGEVSITGELSKRDSSGSQTAVDDHLVNIRIYTIGSTPVGQPTEETIDEEVVTTSVADPRFATAASFSYERSASSLGLREGVPYQVRVHTDFIKSELVPPEVTELEVSGSFTVSPAGSDVTPGTFDAIFGRIIAPPQLGSLKDLPANVAIGTVLNNIIAIIYVIAGIIFLFMIVISAIQWITSGGDKEALAKARGRLTWAIVGIVILALAFVILEVVEGITCFNLFGPPENPCLTT